MDVRVDVGASENGSLKHASWDHLACLLRHWTWANEAMATFDRELATGLDDDDDPMSDHPFGAFYHWCALLCALGEAALEQGPSDTVPARTYPTGLGGESPLSLERADGGCRRSGVVGGAPSHCRRGPGRRYVAAPAASSSRFR